MSSSAPRRPSAARLATALGLDPHPEGGWFRETYRAPEEVATTRGPRPTSTAILFLVTPGSPSRFHRLASDELWVFQGGDPLDLVTLEEGGARHRTLGEPAAGLLPQALVPAGVWQAARVARTADAVATGTAAGGVATADTAADVASAADPGAWSLVSCVVTPGFAYDDFELARRADLVRLYPDLRELITTLT